MARRRQGSSRGAKRGKNLVWTTIVNINVTVLAGATKTGTDIVSDIDWTVISGARWGTIMRTRGWFSCAPIPEAGPTLTGGGVFAYVGVYDKDELSKPASDADTYVDESIMATWGYQFAPHFLGEGGDPWAQVVDIKAMRRITTGKELRFVMTNQMPDALKVSLVIRALVKVDS